MNEPPVATMRAELGRMGVDESRLSDDDLWLLWDKLTRAMARAYVKAAMGLDRA